MTTGRINQVTIGAKGSSHSPAAGLPSTTQANVPLQSFARHESRLQTLKHSCTNRRRKRAHRPAYTSPGRVNCTGSTGIHSLFLTEACNGAAQTLPVSKEHPCDEDDRHGSSSDSQTFPPEQAEQFSTILTAETRGTSAKCLAKHRLPRSAVYAHLHLTPLPTDDELCPDISASFI